MPRSYIKVEHLTDEVFRRKAAGESNREIGKSFGGRDHATVIYAVKKIRELMLTDPRLETLITETERVCSTL